MIDKNDNVVWLPERETLKHVVSFYWNLNKLEEHIDRFNQDLKFKKGDRFESDIREVLWIVLKQL